MNKVAIVLFALLLVLQPSCMAESEGTFVPSYQSFMDSFNAELAEIDASYCDAISRFHKEDAWNEVASSSEDRFVLIDEDAGISISSNEYWWQLVLFTMRIPIGSSEEAAESFISIATAAIRSIYTGVSEQKLESILRICGVDNALERSDPSSSESAAFFDMHTVSSVAKDGYIYLYIEPIRDDGNEYTKITPFGWETK